MKYLYIGIGGIIGAGMRFAIIMVIGQFWQSAFPVDILIINVFGAFVLGYLSTITLPIDPKLKQAITVGVIGSFTTLSTVSADTVLLVESGYFIQGFIYIFCNIALGLVMVYLGMVLGNRKEVRGA
ncbi:MULTISPECIES: fluoride efflux transporter CrcB [Cytobacillus]|uniref:Fluoride-specific ion channel FluC n=1 Tax=Cytobacillus stercorigallinarum TaxID=2762240 RepID=A0ABR8QQB3_9BACI|nr:fluoride efflux transporter CrcB [Cytobacillus stercorigallinarum]MBD7937729.1 fluoride efflux transporter CrcB [Cytobacillus stercorigallinarum]